MEILVCLKQTFDTEEKIRIKNGTIQEEDVEWIINPYDEYAVEEAIRLKEKHGGTVTILSVGPNRVEEAMRRAFAMGADQGIRIETENWKDELDEQAVADLLAATIQAEKSDYDLILCGYMSIDQGSSQVGARLAELLDIPHISTVVSLSIDRDRVYITKDVEGDLERLESTLPILLTTQQGLNEPRYPSLPGIMKAKRKPLIRMKMDELKLDPPIRAKTETVQVMNPPAKQPGKILQGELVDQVQELIGLLQTEAGVIGEEDNE